MKLGIVLLVKMIEPNYLRHCAMRSCALGSSINDVRRLKGGGPGGRGWRGKRNVLQNVIVGGGVSMYCLG